MFRAKSVFRVVPTLIHAKRTIPTSFQKYSALSEPTSLSVPKERERFERESPKNLPKTHWDQKALSMLHASCSNDEKLQTLDECIQQCPYESMYFVFKAHVYTSMQEYQAAVRNYDIAIEFQEKYKDVDEYLYTNKAFALYMDFPELNEKAIANCKECVASVNKFMQSPIGRKSSSAPRNKLRAEIKLKAYELDYKGIVEDVRRSFKKDQESKRHPQYDFLTAYFVAWLMVNHKSRLTTSVPDLFLPSRWLDDVQVVKSAKLEEEKKNMLQWCWEQAKMVDVTTEWSEELRQLQIEA
jgi:tetratricopeptide (TPR) repeat protein